MTTSTNDKKYRKKPVVVEAEQWFPDPTVEAWARANEGNQYVDPLCVIYIYTDRGMLASINTLEGRALLVSPGDWIITGIKGERYPCKPDIFAETYEPATTQLPPITRLGCVALPDAPGEVAARSAKEPTFEQVRNAIVKRMEGHTTDLRSSAAWGTFLNLLKLVEREECDLTPRTERGQTGYASSDDIPAAIASGALSRREEEAPTRPSEALICARSYICQCGERVVRLNDALDGPEGEHK